MGKVLASFAPGFPGAISRAVDDIVKPMAVGASGGIAFGLPVVMNAGKTAVIPFASTNVADDFIGIAVRSGAKTPNEYGSNTAQYNQHEMADILVRGSAVVVCYSGTPALAGAVYIIKSNGRFSADASFSGTENVLIPNAKWLGGKDSSNRAEIVITERSL